jgi:hypothetical protein
MKMNSLLRKLLSRKLWLAIAGIATGIAIALGADASEVETIAGAITTLISALAYIIVEGKVDAESVKNSIIGVEEIVDILNEEGDE